jgi:hypothetical protein
MSGHFEAYEYQSTPGYDALGRPARFVPSHPRDAVQGYEEALANALAGAKSQAASPKQRAAYQKLAADAREGLASARVRLARHVAEVDKQQREVDALKARVERAKDAVDSPKLTPAARAMYRKFLASAPQELDAAQRGLEKLEAGPAALTTWMEDAANGGYLLGDGGSLLDAAQPAVSSLLRPLVDYGSYLGGALGDAAGRFGGVLGGALGSAAGNFGTLNQSLAHGAGSALAHSLGYGGPRRGTLRGKLTRGRNSSHAAKAAKAARADKAARVAQIAKAAKRSRGGRRP